MNHRGEGHGKEQNELKRDLRHSHQRYVGYAQKIYDLCNWIIQGKAKRMIWNHFEEKATVFKFKEKYQLRDIRTL